MSEPKIRWIAKREELIEFAKRLEGQSSIGFDTEFHADQTYWPKVMLLQFSSPTEIALVDALSPEIQATLGGFLEMLKIRKQRLVGHALHQDLAIFARLNGGLPVSVFDTQVAAALVGLGGPLSLAVLVEEVLGVSLPKLFSRADWGRRPLVDGQKAYAAQDVEFLLPVCDALSDQLTSLDRTEWFEAEMKAMLDLEGYLSPDPEEAWKRIGRKPREGTQALNLLKCLAKERELIGQEEDRAPRRILNDDALLDLARRAPETSERLDEQTSRKPNPGLEAFGDRWLNAIREGLELSVEPHQTTGLEESTAIEAAVFMTRYIAQKQKVAPWLCGRVQERLRQAPDALRCSSEQALTDTLDLSGWRSKLLSRPLFQFVSGEVGIGLDQGRVVERSTESQQLEP